eukprot:1352417-Amorphochlora_amoeboformis.AAC.1
MHVYIIHFTSVPPIHFVVSNGYRSTSGSVGAGKSGQSRRLGGGHWGSGQAGAQQVSNPIVTLGSGGRGGT